MTREEKTKILKSKKHINRSGFYLKKKFFSLIIYYIINNNKYFIIHKSIKRFNNKTNKTNYY